MGDRYHVWKFWSAVWNETTVHVKHIDVYSSSLLFVASTMQSRIGFLQFKTYSLYISKKRTRNRSYLKIVEIRWNSGLAEIQNYWAISIPQFESDNNVHFENNVRYYIINAIDLAHLWWLRTENKIVLFCWNLDAKVMDQKTRSSLQDNVHDCMPFSTFSQTMLCSQETMLFSNRFCVHL